jgi:hypothetical protein
MDSLDDSEATALPSQEQETEQMDPSIQAGPASLASTPSSSPLVQEAVRTLTPAQLSEDLPRLADNQEEEMTSELLQPIKMWEVPLDRHTGTNNRQNIL